MSFHHFYSGKPLTHIARELGISDFFPEIEMFSVDVFQVVNAPEKAISVH